MRYAQPELVDRLAAAYVLGTLSQRARRRFERLHRDRADVQLAVGGWEARLNRLGASVPPVQPPHRVWRTIEEDTRKNVATPAPGTRARWWLPAGAGALGVLAGGALVAALLFVLPSLMFTPDQVAMRAGQKLPQSYVGLLTDAQGNGKLLISSLRHGRTMTMKVIGPITPPAAGHRTARALGPAARRRCVRDRHRAHQRIGHERAAGHLREAAGQGAAPRRHGRDRGESRRAIRDALHGKLREVVVRCLRARSAVHPIPFSGRS